MSIDNKIFVYNDEKDFEKFLDENYIIRKSFFGLLHQKFGNE